MAYYIDVKVKIDGRLVATGQRADLEITHPDPDGPLITIDPVTWTGGNVLDYLQKLCTFEGTGPNGEVTQQNLKVYSVNLTRLRLNRLPT